MRGLDRDRMVAPSHTHLAWPIGRRGERRCDLRAPRRSITINIVPAPITSSHRELITVRNCAVYTDEMNRSGESNDKVDAHIIEGCASDGGGCIGGDVKASEP